MLVVQVTSIIIHSSRVIFSALHSASRSLHQQN
uniref:Uncharacterized protein n=1 Tax=Arundo donax TaxID=35708 RepID=A0A0A8ZCK8_ARUDO